jgi:hypothetical protein
VVQKDTKSPSIHILISSFSFFSDDLISYILYSVSPYSQLNCLFCLLPLVTHETTPIIWKWRKFLLTSVMIMISQSIKFRYCYFRVLWSSSSQAQCVYVDINSSCRWWCGNTRFMFVWRFFSLWRFLSFAWLGYYKIYGAVIAGHLLGLRSKRLHDQVPVRAQVNKNKNKTKNDSKPRTTDIRSRCPISILSSKSGGFPFFKNITAKKNKEQI